MHEIFKLHRISKIIIFYCDEIFTFKLWISIQKSSETKLNFSTTFHAHQIINLRGLSQCLNICWDCVCLILRDYISLTEFTYNNRLQSSIIWHLVKHYMVGGIGKFSLRHKWERKFMGPELANNAIEKIKLNRDKLRLV